MSFNVGDMLVYEHDRGARDIDIVLNVAVENDIVMLTFLSFKFFDKESYRTEIETITVQKKHFLPAAWVHLEEWSDEH